MSGAVRPRVTLKLATSLDGRIATASGESRWITGEAARATVHGLRAAHEAVLVGSGTALADDPELTARTTPEAVRQPMRVVLDTDARLPTGSKLARGARTHPVLLIAAPDAPAERVAALQALGVEVARAPRTSEGLDIEAALGALAIRGIGTVLVEGGGRVAASLILADLVDHLEWMRAPIILGGDGLPGVAALALAQLKDAPHFRRVRAIELGADLWETYERIG